MKQTNEKKLSKLQVALNRVEELEARNEELTKTRRVVKEYSDYFLNKKGEPQIYGNMSETKKHLESKHDDILKTMLGVDKAKNDEFNTILAAVLRKGLDL